MTDTPDDRRPPRPDSIGAIIGTVLKAQGIATRVAQHQVLPEWAAAVGAQIDLVTAPQHVRGDGTLVVAVTTHAWMHELSLLEPQLLARLNSVPGRPAIRRIHWQLVRPDEPIVGDDRVR
jgi:predicted nucleic acid-binding Zn ribbon protein